MHSTSLPFEKLFGVPAAGIKKHVVLCPGNDASLFCDNKTEKLHTKGHFFGVSNTDHFSIITTKYNLHIGDCVLSLKDTPCKNIYLFGSCGGLGNTEIGDAFLINKAFDYEGFSQMLKKSDRTPEPSFPDKSLYETFNSFAKLDNAYCATVSSFILESDQSALLLTAGISCVDMEASIVFSAASHIGRKAIAVFYATDLINKKPFWEPLCPHDIATIKKARMKSATILNSFICRDPSKS